MSVADTIKKFIENFGKLIAVIGIALTMLANAGLITYNAVSNDKKKELRSRYRSVAEHRINRETSDNRIRLVPDNAITSFNAYADTIGSIIPASTPIIDEIKKELFNGGNVILLIFSLLFGIPLLIKKRKGGDKNARTDKTTD